MEKNVRRNATLFFSVTKDQFLCQNWFFEFLNCKSVLQLRLVVILFNKYTLYRKVVPFAYWVLSSAEWFSLLNLLKTITC